MSTTIEERVARLKFDTQGFDTNIKDTIKKLDKLDEKLRFDEAKESLEDLDKTTKRMDFSNVANGMNSVVSASAGFIAKMTLIQRYTTKAVDAVEQLGKTMLGITDMNAGMNKFEDMTRSTQTIVAATGKTTAEVDKALERLNYYTDMTSYDFSAMVSSIGKFTSVGVDLNDAITAMMGIGNEAARSGAGKMEANRAMYNFAQALATGSVKLIDWKSIENANMATKEFKEQLIETAKELGVLDETGKIIGDKSGTIVTFQHFNETLQKGWLNSNVLIKTLKKYGDTTTDIGKVSYAAAKNALTFKDAMDAISDAASSGWMKTYKIVFGDLEEAIELFTGLCDSIIEVMDVSTTARNNVLENWKKLGGRTQILEGIKDLWESIVSLMEAVKRGILDAFYPPVDQHGSLLDILNDIKDETDSFIKSSHLLDISKAIKDFGQSIRLWLYTPAENGLLRITNIRLAVQNFWSTIKGIIDGISGFFSKYGTIVKMAAGIAAAFMLWGRIKTSGGIFEFIRHRSKLTKIISVLGLLFTLMKSFGEGGLGTLFKNSPFKPIIDSFNGFAEQFKESFNKIFEAFNTTEIGQKVKAWYDKTIASIKQALGLGPKKKSLLDLVPGNEKKTSDIPIISSIANFFSGLTEKLKAPEFVEKFVAKLQAVAEWFKLLRTDAGKAFGSLWETFTGFFKKPEKEAESANGEEKKGFSGLFAKVGEFFSSFFVGSAKAEETEEIIEEEILEETKEAEQIIKEVQEVEGVIADKAQEAADAVGSSTTDIKNASNDANNASQENSNWFTNIWNSVSTFFKPVGDAFSSVATWLSSLDLSGLLTTIEQHAEIIGRIAMVFSAGMGIRAAGRGVARMGSGLKALGKGFKTVSENFGDIVSNFKPISFSMTGIGNQANVLSTFTKRNEKIGTMILKIAASIAIVVGALAALMVIVDAVKPEDMNQLLITMGWLAGGLVVMFGLLKLLNMIGGTKIPNNFGTQTLSIAAALAALTGILYLLNDENLNFEAGRDRLLQLVAIVAGLIVVMGAARGLAGENASKFNFIGMTIAIASLVGIVKILMNGFGTIMEFLEAYGKLVALSAIVAVLNLVCGRSAQLTNGNKMRVKFVSIAAGLLAMTGVISVLGIVPNEMWDLGLTRLVIILGILTVVKLIFAAIDAFPNNNNRKGMRVLSTFVGIAVAMIALSRALQRVQNIDVGTIAIFGVAISAIAFAISHIVLNSRYGGDNKQKIGALFLTIVGVIGIIYMMTDAILRLKDISWEKIASFSGGIALIAGAMAAMMAFARGSKNESGYRKTTFLGLTAMVLAFAEIVGIILLLVNVINDVKDVPWENMLSFAGAISIIGISISAMVALLRGKKGVKFSSIIALLIGFISVAGVIFVLGDALVKIKDVPIEQMWHFAAIVAALAIVIPLISLLGHIISVGAAFKLGIALVVLVGAIGLALQLADLLGGAAIESFTGRMQRIGWHLEDFTESCANIKSDNVSNITDTFTELATASTKIIGINSQGMLSISVEANQIASNLKLTSVTSGEIAVSSIDNMDKAFEKIQTMSTTYSDISVDGLVKGTTGLTRLSSRLKLFGESSAKFDITNLSNAEAVTGTINKLYTDLKDVKDLGDMSTAIANIGGAISLYYKDIDGITFTKSNTPDGETISNVFDTLATNLPSKENRDKIVEFGQSLGGTNSNGITDFAIGITNLGTAIAGYSTAIGDGQIATANKITESLTAIAALNDKLPDVGISEITAFGVTMKAESPQTKLEQFAEDVAALGSAVASFGKEMSVEGIDSTKIKTGTDALTAIAALSTETIKLDSFYDLAGYLAGNTGIDLDKFPGQVSALGTAVADFGKSVGADEVDLDKVTRGVGVLSAIAGVQSSMPAVGGIASWIHGNKSLGDFATGIGDLGKGIANFAKGVNESTDYTNVEAAVSAIKVLAEAQGSLQKTGGLGAIFTGGIEYGAFATGMGELGTGIKNFVTNLGDTEVGSKILTAAKSLKHLAEAQFYLSQLGKHDAEFTTQNFVDLANGFVAFDGVLKGKQIGENTKGFAELVKTLIECEAMFSNDENLLNRMSSWLTEFSTNIQMGVDVKKLESVATSLQTITGAFYTAGTDSSGSLLSGLTDGIQNGTDLVTSAVQPILTALNNQQGEFVTVGDYFVQGLNTGITNATWSKTNNPIKSAEQLAKLCIAAIEDTWIIRSPSHVGEFDGIMFVRGINEGVVREGPILVRNAVAVAEDVVKATNNILNSSPLGLKGLIKGLDRDTKKVKSATTDIAENMINSLGSGNKTVAGELNKTKKAVTETANAGTSLLEMAKGAVESTVETAVKGFTRLLGIGQSQVQQSADSTVEAVQTAADKAEKAAEGVADSTGKAAEASEGVITKVAKGLGDTLKEYGLDSLIPVKEFETKAGALETAMSSVVGGIGDAWSKAAEGGSFWDNPAEYIRRVGDSLKGADKSEFIGAVKTLMGIDGEEADLLFHLNVDDPDGIMDKLESGALDDVKANLGGAGGGSGSGSGSRSYKGSMQGEGLSFDYAKRFAGQLASGNLAIGVGTGEYTLADVLARMDLMQQAIENMQVVLDTGVIAGGLTTQIDKNLGRQVALNGRGV